MEVSKRCGNCGRYPFCNRTNGASDCCENWIKRKLEVRKNSGDEKR